MATMMAAPSSGCVFKCSRTNFATEAGVTLEADMPGRKAGAANWGWSGAESLKTQVPALGSKV